MVFKEKLDTMPSLSVKNKCEKYIRHLLCRKSLSKSFSQDKAEKPFLL